MKQNLKIQNSYNFSILQLFMKKIINNHFKCLLNKLNKQDIKNLFWKITLFLSIIKLIDF